MRRFVFAVVCGVLIAVTAPQAAAFTHDWPRFGFDAARSNSSTATAGISAGDLSHLERQDVAVPGTVDSSPVYLYHVEAGGRVRDVFVATTSYGRTLSLDADSGKIVWTYTPASLEALAGSTQYTTSSPVADRQRGYVYAPSPDGLIHKLSLKTGHEVRSKSWPATITLDPGHEKISSALNLSGANVIATTAGYGSDPPTYQGHVVLVDRDSGVVKHVFNALCANRHHLFKPSTCGESDAGIWGRSGAVVIPGSHRLLVTTGNAAWDGKTNWGDSVLELSADATRLEHNWTPTNQAAMRFYDVDLGAMAPALLRSGRRWFAVQSGKDGEVRLLDLADLNGHDHACACVGGELQTIDIPGDPGFSSTVASWRHGGTSWAFVTNYVSTTAYRLSGRPARLKRVWTNGRTGTSPIIAGGLMYVYDPTGGGVAVYRPASGKVLGILPAGKGHWNSPVVADGRVAIPLGDANAFPLSGAFTIYRKR
jgi:hypothetical protein